MPLLYRAERSLWDISLINYWCRRGYPTGGSGNTGWVFLGGIKDSSLCKPWGESHQAVFFHDICFSSFLKFLLEWILSVMDCDLRVARWIQSFSHKFAFHQGVFNHRKRNPNEDSALWQEFIYYQYFKVSHKHESAPW